GGHVEPRCHSPPPRKSSHFPAPDGRRFGQVPGVFRATIVVSPSRQDVHGRERQESNHQFDSVVSIFEIHQLMTGREQPSVPTPQPCRLVEVTPTEIRGTGGGQNRLIGLLLHD